jgi:hypothetical protein
MNRNIHKTPNINIPNAEREAVVRYPELSSSGTGVNLETVFYFDVEVPGLYVV